MKSRFHLLANAAALLLSPALHAATYSVTDLGTLDAPFVKSAALAINASGVVVGTSRPAGLGSTHAARFSGTGSGNTDLSTTGTFSQATAINAAGQIVGSVSSSGISQPLLFSGTGTGNTDLGTLGGTIGQAFGINAGGQIVGMASTSGNSAVRATGFSGTGAGNTDLGALGGTNSRANAINDASQVVGSADLLGDGANHAVRFGPFQANIDLGTLGGTNSSANAINANGVIVGEGDILGDTASHAALFSGLGGGNTDLETLGGTGSSAKAINASGRIVGSSQIPGDAATHGFLYTGGAMVDLNTLIDPASGWTITDAAGINDAGQIAATGSNGTVDHALLLTPIPPAPTIQVTGKKSLRTTKAKLTIKGKSTGSVTSVTYMLGKATRTAAGTTSWHFTAKLKPGKNRITVTAHGHGGDSTPAKITITRN